jgi:predicted nucleic-acid-binding Zn-ribbon protein
MKRTQTCPKCGSQDIVCDAKVIDRGHNNRFAELTIATYGKPDALVFRDKRETTVSAWLCTACGFVELYADSPAIAVA